MADAAIKTPEPKAVSVTPPKMKGRGKTQIHGPEVIAAIASSAAKGWTSNGLEYKTKSGAQGACQTVKEAIVEAGHAGSTKDLTARVYSLDGEAGPFVFAIAAKAAVR